MAEEILEGTIIERLVERIDLTDKAVLTMDKAWANVLVQALVDASNHINYIPEVRNLMMRLASDIQPREKSN